MPTCIKCNQQFEITQSDLDFYAQISVPSPTLCPDCRWVRRLLERNTRNLYMRKCDFSGEEIISQFHENQPFPVYHWSVWWSDKWDATKFARPIDFSKSFFPQFYELKKVTPHLSAFVIGETLTNSMYTNCTGYLKNCYLIFESDYDEDCYYSNRIYHSQNCIDCMNCYKCEVCYEAIDCQNCYNLKYSTDCENSSDSYFLSNCKSCKNCIGCINLRHKSYCIFNEEYTEEEYGKALKKYNLSTLEGVVALKKESENFQKTQPHKNLQQEHNENSLGDYLYDSKNAFYCYDCKDLEDCKYCSRASMTVKNAMDYTAWGDKAELIYECAACGNNAYNLKFCTTCTTNNSNLEYCNQCTGCNECFGCVSLKRKRYCILNKQYEEEEYFDLKKRLINLMKIHGEYGEFFPDSFAPFAYNESLAMEVFPQTKEQILSRGFKWFESENIASSRKYEDVITCKSCNKNYKLITQELEFYKARQIPIPEKCFNCRYRDRLATRNPKKLFESKCDNCEKKIMTSYSQNLAQKSSVRPPIYCEECYLGTLL